MFYGSVSRNGYQFVSFFLQYEEVAEKDDLMGMEDTAKKDILELTLHSAWRAGASDSSLQGTASYLFLWDLNL